jgi:hypothetical protein
VNFCGSGAEWAMYVNRIAWWTDWQHFAGEPPQVDKPLEIKKMSLNNSPLAKPSPI